MSIELFPLSAAFNDPDDTALIGCDVCKSHLIHRDSAKTPCGHFVCVLCFGKVEEVCPVCSEPVRYMKKVDLFIANLVETRKMHCIFPGCEWKGVYGPCGHDFMTHVQLCGYAPWQCQDCGVKLTRSASSTHPAICPNRKIKCVNECGQVLSLADVETHGDVCTHAVVPCPFSALGCVVTMKRCDVDKHNRACMSQHFQGVLLKVSALEQRNDALEKKLDECRAVSSVPPAAEPSVKRRRGRPPGVKNNTAKHKDAMSPLEAHIAVTSQLDTVLAFPEQRDGQQRVEVPESKRYKNGYCLFTSMASDFCKDVDYACVPDKSSAEMMSYIRGLWNALSPEDKEAWKAELPYHEFTVDRKKRPSAKRLKSEHIDQVASADNAASSDEQPQLIVTSPRRKVSVFGKEHHYVPRGAFHSPMEQ